MQSIDGIFPYKYHYLVLCQGKITPILGFNINLLPSKLYLWRNEKTKKCYLDEESVP